VLYDKLDIPFLSFVVAAIGGALALWQYWKNQRWRETEFIAKEAKDFFENELVIKALKILDWSVRKIEFAPNELETVDRGVLRGALRSGGDAEEFSDEEVYVRDLFDTFFDRLGRFDQYIKSGVVTFKQVESYFRYWGDLLTGKRPELLDKDTLESIWKFLRCYGFKDTVEFLSRFGKAPETDDGG
jgi:hypothetical protein